MSIRQPSEPVLGESDAFLAVMERASQAACVSKPVLVIGERGCGKELIASRIHYLSERWQQPLIKFNCAALNEELLDSELFGHVAGAYTGASRNRAGRFESADGGTLFLDELSSMSQRLQEKLLRVVEYGEYERVGDSATRKVDVRMVGAANVDLPALASRGEFRADLLDRLAFEVITVPPLRYRREDIPLLAQAFAEDMAKELGHSLFAGFTSAVHAQLLAHDWPGNVRELRNVIERAVYALERPEAKVSRIELDPFASPYRPIDARQTKRETAACIDQGPVANSDAVVLPSDLRAPINFHEESARHERSMLEQALINAQHKQTLAAESLALSYHQFRGLLKKYDLLPSARGKSSSAKRVLK